MAGGSLVIKHDVAEVHEADHASLSDVQTPAGWTKAQVIWDLSVTGLDDVTCQCTNPVITYLTRAFLDGLEATGQTFEHGTAGPQAAVSGHNRRETPLLAASIERKALATPSSLNVHAAARRRQPWLISDADNE